MPEVSQLTRDGWGARPLSLVLGRPYEPTLHPTVPGGDCPGSDHGQKVEVGPRLCDFKMYTAEMGRKPKGRRTGRRWTGEGGPRRPGALRGVWCPPSDGVEVTLRTSPEEPEGSLSRPSSRHPQTDFSGTHRTKRRGDRTITQPPQPTSSPWSCPDVHIAHPKGQGHLYQGWKRCSVLRTDRAET